MYRKPRWIGNEYRDVNTSLEHRDLTDYKRAEKLLRELEENEQEEAILVGLLNQVTPNELIDWDNDLVNVKKLFGDEWSRTGGLSYCANEYDGQWRRFGATPEEKEAACYPAIRELITILPELHWPSQIYGAVRLINEIIRKENLTIGENFHELFADMDRQQFFRLFNRPLSGLHSWLVDELFKLYKTIGEDAALFHELPLVVKIYTRLKDDNLPDKNTRQIWLYKELLQTGVRQSES